MVMEVFLTSSEGLGLGGCTSIPPSQRDGPVLTLLPSGGYLLIYLSWYLN